MVVGQRFPAVVDLHVGSLHRCPGCAVSNLFLPFVFRMGGKGVVECFPIDVLRVRWEVSANSRGKIDVCAIGHGSCIGRSLPRLARDAAAFPPKRIEATCFRLLTGVK